MKKKSFSIVLEYNLNGKNKIRPVKSENSLFQLGNSRFVSVNSDYVGNLSKTRAGAINSAYLCAANPDRGNKNKINGRVTLLHYAPTVKARFVANYEIYGGVLDNISFVIEINRNNKLGSKTILAKSVIKGESFDEEALSQLVQAMENIKCPTAGSKSEVEIVGNNKYHKTDLSIDFVTDPDEFFFNVLSKCGEEEMKAKGNMSSWDDLTLCKDALKQLLAELNKVSTL